MWGCAARCSFPLTFWKTTSSTTADTARSTVARKNTGDNTKVQTGLGGQVLGTMWEILCHPRSHFCNKSQDQANSLERKKFVPSPWFTASHVNMAREWWRQEGAAGGVLQRLKGSRREGGGGCVASIRRGWAKLLRLEQQQAHRPCRRKCMPASLPVNREKSLVWSTRRRLNGLCRRGALSDWKEDHRKELAPARTQWKKENWFTNSFKIPPYPADLRFSHFTVHLGLIKISFKDYKGLVFWKGIELAYCANEMIPGLLPISVYLAKWIQAENRYSNSNF